MSLSLNNHKCNNIHFIGIFGSGMSAIAQYLRWQGLSISGSDRLNTSKDTALIKNKLLEIGCTIFEQDGSGVQEDTDAICVSTAIEDSNPDVSMARKKNIPIFHRSDLLAAIVKNKRTIAVAGTSGKSTVTAMIFEFLSYCSVKPSLISGAAIRRLQNMGFIGNAFYDDSDILVIEADESDGTLVKYEPEMSLILNISKDHKSIEDVLELFKTLSAHSKWTAINADDKNLGEINKTTTFGSISSAHFFPEKIEYNQLSTTLTFDSTPMDLPLPGLHNAQNCIAALCVCEHLGCNRSQLSNAVRNYQGVARRFSISRSSGGVTIIDDFAHNPEKIRAAINTARNLAEKLFVIYQPHGFGPTRFLKNEYAGVFKTVINPEDTLYLLPIYYAGGSAVKDICSKDILELMGDVPFSTHTPQNRKELLSLLRQKVMKNDCILLMGARDPSLPELAKNLSDQL